MPEKQTYYVTGKAGDFVAGRRSPGKDKPIDLTPAEAEHDLILGALSETAPDAEVPPADPETPARRGKPAIQE